MPIHVPQLTELLDLWDYSCDSNWYVAAIGSILYNSSVSEVYYSVQVLLQRLALFQHTGFEMKQ